MNQLQQDLYEVCQSTKVMGLDLGATVDPSDIDALQMAIRVGLMGKGWREPFTVSVTLDDIWQYFRGGKLIEDETGCAHVVVKHGLMTANAILNWVHVNGSINVDTDGDGV